MTVTPTIAHRIITEVGNRVSGMDAIPGSPWQTVTIAERKVAETETYLDGVVEITVAKAPSRVDGVELQYGYTVWSMDVAVSAAIAQPTTPVDENNPTEAEQASLDWLGLHGINTILQAVNAPADFRETGTQTQLAQTVEVADTAIGRTDDESEAGVTVIFRFTFQTRTDNLALTA